MDSDPTFDLPASRTAASFTLDQTRLTLATTFFGVNASWMLLAFIVVQTYAYSRHAKTDALYIRRTVYGLLILQTAQTAVESLFAYRDLVYDRGDPLIAVDVAAAIASNIQPVLGALTGFVVQLFFVARMWTFSVAMMGPRMKILLKCVCVSIGIVGLVSCSSILAFFILALTASGSSASTLRAAGDLLIIWTIFSAIADTAITVCMIAILCHAKSTVHFRETRDRISRVIRATIQTGFLTAVLALLIPVLLLIPGHAQVSGFYAFTGYLLGKSYAMSLLANLKARIRPGATASGSVSLGTAQPSYISSMAFTPAPTVGLDVRSRLRGTSTRPPTLTRSTSHGDGSNVDLEAQPVPGGRNVRSVSTSESVSQIGQKAD